MDYIELPDDTPREASFFLSMEEYVAHHANATDCFFTWQVGPSVIFGRNQVAEAEVNLDYCRSRGIATFRRKSGGGCVYADRGNVMMSYITQAGPVGFTYNKYVSLVLLALRRMGIEAAASGRNDIVAGGGKVSGTAFYHLPGRNIVHGTLLYDTDTQNMAQALTPPAAKLQGKGVRSVRQRIALLKDFTQLSPDGLRAGLRRELCQGSTRLTAADVAAIERIEAEYRSPEFIFGKNPPCTVVRSRRTEGVGSVEARVSLHAGKIRSISFRGDFLPGDVPIERLAEALRGARLEPESLGEALRGGEAGAIRGMDAQTLISLLTEQT